MGEPAGYLEHLANHISLADLQFFTEHLELLDACEGTLDVDAQAGNVGGVLRLFFGKILLPVPAFGRVKELCHLSIEQMFEQKPSVC